jgi:hypothetical protein
MHIKSRYYDAYTCSQAADLSHVDNRVGSSIYGEEKNWKKMAVTSYSLLNSLMDMVKIFVDLDPLP